ncbi:MAG: hypothetical protein EBU90_08360 [Proteobacteria bacterium]|nr:hypothetical protein [Pseudomonadota bacterium]
MMHQFVDLWKYRFNWSNLSISCFLNEVQDNMKRIADAFYENTFLASSGGGIGTYWGNVRSINEPIKDRGTSSGVIPFIKVQDSQSLAISQGAIRRGSSAAYLDISHPEIEEFIDIRRPTGGDPNRRSLNVHHGVCINDEFMQALETNKDWELKSPKDGKVIEVVKPRDLWIKILNARIETGEPYILYTGNVDKNRSKVYEANGLKCKTSNLCVAPETLILTSNGWQEIQSCENEKTVIWNGFEWSEVTPVKTGENQKLFSVTTNTGNKIECTEYHKWYIEVQDQRSHQNTIIIEKRTHELNVGDIIIDYTLPIYPSPMRNVMIASIENNGRISDTYCFTEPKRNMAVFNGILTGNCSEIMLTTGLDYNAKERTAVCCLSSLNLEYYDTWKDNALFIEDIYRFLDNVLDDFIKRAPDSIQNAKYSAMMERSVGLGVMGFHSFLQSKNTPIEGVAAKSWNKQIFKHIRAEADKANLKLAEEKGSCTDAERVGIKARFSNLLAVAPTASISIIANSTSPAIEPLAANCFTQKTLSGSFVVKNQHLEKLLIEKERNNDKTWSSIALNEGSVQHLDFFTKEEKDIFKTAIEINQKWLIEHAADRQEFIDQGQSLNLFVPANISKKELHDLHFSAWKKGVKSLYYCRSVSVQRSEKPQDVLKQKPIEIQTQTPKYEECLACQ